MPNPQCSLHELIKKRCELFHYNLVIFYLFALFAHSHVNNEQVSEQPNTSKEVCSCSFANENPNYCSHLFGSVRCSVFMYQWRARNSHLVLRYTPALKVFLCHDQMLFVLYHTFYHPKQCRPPPSIAQG